MGITIGAKPDSSFADPLGLLSDCHRRIEKFLQMLIAVATESQEFATAAAANNRDADVASGDPRVATVADTLTPEQRRTLEVSLRYFREAAPRHTRDEEESLFPKLRECGDESARAAFAAIDALEADHETADAGHAEVNRLGSQWLSHGRLSPEETTMLLDILLGLRSLYRKHIAIEDTQIFPLAERLLDKPTIRVIGREMADRRGIDLDAITDLKLRCPTRRD